MFIANESGIQTNHIEMRVLFDQAIIVYILMFLLLPISVFSQSYVKYLNVNPVERKNEIKLNIGLTLYGFPEITYDRILGRNLSVGVSVGFKINKKIDFNYWVMPNLRYFLEIDNELSVFGEANLAIYSGHEFLLDLDNCICTDPSEIALGGGLAAGTKRVSDNLVLEVFAGLGVWLASITPEQGAIMYPRIGVSVGKRF